MGHFLPYLLFLEAISSTRNILFAHCRSCVYLPDYRSSWGVFVCLILSLLALHTIHTRALSSIIVPLSPSLDLAVLFSHCRSLWDTKISIRLWLSPSVLRLSSWTSSRRLCSSRAMDSLGSFCFSDIYPHDFTISPRTWRSFLVSCPDWLGSVDISRGDCVVSEACFSSNF